MSKGKYSPALSRADANRPYTAYCYNADRQIPPTTWVAGNTRIHLANYDENGYDSYGYSAFNADGDYIGIGEGIDRNGYTEMDYLGMNDDEFDNL
jgi:hypothetical protein